MNDEVQEIRKLREDMETFAIALICSFRDCPVEEALEHIKRVRERNSDCNSIFL